MTEGERSIGISDILFALYDHTHKLGSSFNTAGIQWDKLDEDGKRNIGDQLKGEIDSRNNFVVTVKQLLEQLSEYGIEGDIPPEVLTILGLEVQTARYRKGDQEQVISHVEVENVQLRDMSKDRADALRVVWKILPNGEEAETEAASLSYWFNDQIEDEAAKSNIPINKIEKKYLKQITGSMSRHRLSERVRDFVRLHQIETSQELPIILPETKKHPRFLSVLMDLNEVEAYEGKTLAEMLDMIYKPRGGGREKK